MNPGTTEDRDRLVAAAREACRSAHAPYSGIHVGVAIRSAAGATYTGTNVENAAYPLGNCAEASAIAAGVARGRRALSASRKRRCGPSIARAMRSRSRPCGGCRQRIHEFAENAARQHPLSLGRRGGATASVNELLPYAFELPASRNGR